MWTAARRCVLCSAKRASPCEADTSDDGQEAKKLRLRRRGEKSGNKSSFKELGYKKRSIATAFFFSFSVCFPMSVGAS